MEQPQEPKPVDIARTLGYRVESIVTLLAYMESTPDPYEDLLTYLLNQQPQIFIEVCKRLGIPLQRYRK